VSVYKLYGYIMVILCARVFLSRFMRQVMVYF